MYFISKTFEPIIPSDLTRLRWYFSSEYWKVAAFAGITGSERGLSGYAERRPLCPSSAGLIAVSFAFLPSLVLQGKESPEPPHNHCWPSVSQLPEGYSSPWIWAGVAREQMNSRTGHNFAHQQWATTEVPSVTSQWLPKSNGPPRRCSCSPQCGKSLGKLTVPEGETGGISPFR